MAGGIGGGGAGGGLGGFGGGGEPEPKDNDPVALKQNAVNEELVWRARAVRAETQLSELEERLSELEAELEKSRTESSRVDRRRTLELELAMADAQDVETAAIVAERMLADMPEPDIKAVVADLRATRPFLFRTRPAASAMSGRVVGAGIGTQLDELADEARETGDRGALLRYLRARRSN